jgi:SAM-dependent methyltransferase
MAPHDCPSRTPDSIRHQYRIEHELADRLRGADKRSRQKLYACVYNELFRRVPDHPQLQMKLDRGAEAAETARQFLLLKPFLNPTTTYLEIGAGSCALATQVSKRVHNAYALDVSDEITGTIHLPPNLQLIISDGTSIPVPANSVDLAYSNQLMEHLHPDDALEQLRNIAQALAPNGKYVCITPNKLCGPHDISRDFDDVATGLHLREYDNRELMEIFSQAGFHRFYAVLSWGSIVIPWSMPLMPFRWFERALSLIPVSARRRAARLLLAVKLVAVK